MFKKPSHIAFLSVCSNTLVVTIKMIVGVLTGSVAIISEAIHTLLDLLASCIAFISVKLSSRPPDKNHPYGHGKIENLSGTIETMLIFVAGIWIIVESVKKIINPEPVSMPSLGIAVMLFGAFMNFIVSRIVNRAAVENHSIAMRSNAFHLLTDVYTSLGVAFGLLIVSVTNWTFLDPLIGIGLAMYIMIEAIHLWKESFNPLLDNNLPEETEDEIRQIIDRFDNEFIEYHNLRTRRSGPVEYIDFHLIVNKNTSIEVAHELCNRIEFAIKERFHRAETFIHLEPEEEAIYKKKHSSN